MKNIYCSFECCYRHCIDTYIDPFESISLLLLYRNKVFINEKDVGIFALEESFEKRLIENNKLPSQWVVDKMKLNLQ